MVSSEATTAQRFGNLRLTRKCAFAINVDHARSAQTGTAPEFRTGQLELFPNDPQERRLGRRIGTDRLAVDAKLGSHLRLLCSQLPFTPDLGA